MNKIDKDEKYMELALIEAKKAYQMKEVPVGAVIVYEDKVISSGFNMRETKNSALAHAEMIAINNACEYLKSWRLTGCNLYVTLEPCPMCAGAIINSRITRIIYGAKDFKAGSLGSVFDIFSFKFNHRPTVLSGVLEKESANLLQNFFHQIREGNIKKPM